MKKRIPFVPVLLVLALAGLMLSGIACNLLLPFSACPGLSTPSLQTYKCTAQIYRVIPGTNQEFTENWQTWLWPGTNNDYEAGLACGQLLNNYTGLMMKHGLPEFDWQIRDFSVSQDPKPAAADCSIPAPRTVYGAPVGNELALWAKDKDVSVTAYVEATDSNGNLLKASPTVMNANFVYAERTGMGVDGGDLDGGSYDPTIQHLRFSDMRIEFEAFDIGSFHMSKFYIQSIGTIIAMGGPVNYTILPNAAKFYMWGTIEAGGNQTVDGLCFVNSFANSSANVTEIDFGLPYFAFSFNVTNVDPSNLCKNLQIQKIQLSLNTPNPTTFLHHQPVVYLKDKLWHTTSGILTIEVGDFIGDQDIGDLDLSKILWFENFEMDNEIFLGNMGNSLFLPVNLSWGQHKITVVVYDKEGSYATSTMNLTIQRLPGDVDGDGQVCSKDIQLIMAARGQKATGPDDPRDINKDGWITVGDAAKATSLCTYSNCVCK